MTTIAVVVVTTMIRSGVAAVVTVDAAAAGGTATDVVFQSGGRQLNILHNGTVAQEQEAAATAAVTSVFCRRQIVGPKGELAARAAFEGVGAGERAQAAAERGLPLVHQLRRSGPLHGDAGIGAGGAAGNAGAGGALGRGFRPSPVEGRSARI